MALGRPLNILQVVSQCHWHGSRTCKAKKERVSNAKMSISEINNVLAQLGSGLSNLKPEPLCVGIKPLYT